MAKLNRCNFPPAIASCSSRTLRRPNQPANSIDVFKPFSSSRRIINPSPLLLRLRVHRRTVVLPKRSNRLLAVSGLLDDNSETCPEAEKTDSDAGATLDIKLPRRSLLVQFTCGECGETTQRLINRLAYERGLVFVQCAGCERYHKLADNLGLIVEYDLREEGDADQL